MGYNEKKDILEEKMCSELEMLRNKYEATGKELEEKDLQRMDMLWHALKSKATYEAMVERQEEMEMGGEGMSGRRMRNPNTGRFMSRSQDGGMYGRMTSGYYPPYPPSPDGNWW